MALQSFRLPCDNQSANFKLVGQTLNAFFAGIGMVQTSDTGQVNWSTFTTVTNTSGWSVYEIWRFNDAFQSNCPFVMRVDYVVMTTNNQMGLYFTFGQGSSGAGVVQPAWGQWAPMTTQPVSATSNILSDCFMNGGPGWFSLMMWREITSISNTAQNFVLAVERSRDVYGNMTGDYWTVAVSGGNQVAQQSCPAPGSGSNPPYDNGWWNLLLPRGASSTVWGNNVGTSPVYPWLGKAGNPMMALMAVGTSDMGEMQTGRVNIYGNDHMYLFTKINNLTRALKNSGGSCGVGIRMD